MIDQKAREIAEEVGDIYDYEHNVILARLGIIEGRRQAFEEAAKVAENNDSMEGHGAVIAEAVRALIEDQH